MINQRLNALKDRIAAGETLVGTGVFLTDPVISEQLGNLGFDFVWIDGEHTVFSNEQIRNHIMAAELAGMATFVRVPDHDPATVKPLLEVAPDAVIFPMVNTAEEARQVVAACLYPPKGVRGYGPLRAHRFGTVPNGEYVADVAGCFWRIMQIEHALAVENLEEILHVEGVDSIVVGPNDLSASIGHLGEYRHPDVMALMDRIGETCRRCGVPFGVSLGYDEQNIRDWVRRGASWIEVGADWGYLQMGAQKNLEDTRRLCQEKEAAG